MKTEEYQAPAVKVIEINPSSIICLSGGGGGGGWGGGVED